MKENYNLVNRSIISDAINDYAFINNENLTELIIPEGTKHIGERAFFGCKNIKKVTLPQSLISIGASAFSECENIEEIVLPENIKKLNYRTFADCKRLKKVIIPDGVEELEWAVFAGCENLEEIILPESIKKIDKQLFLNCKKLKNVILPSNLEAVPDECFMGCSSLDIILSKNINSIGSRSFQKCYKLSNFPQNAITFGESCFKDCRNLIVANINPKTTFLPDGMFDGCIKLEEIIYNDDKKLNIGKKCFRNCKTLNTIPTFIRNYNERAFENCIGITSIDIIDSTIPMACFRGCSNLKTINGQEKIFNIDAFAFSGCENLEEINIFNLNIISAEAFSHCKKLKKINLNLGIETIGSRAFFNCQALYKINLPDMIKTIKKEAFKNCSSIQTITIPAFLTSFGDGAFSYMESLENIYVSPHNNNFFTPDNKILINEMQQKLVLYASGCKNKVYSLKDYNIEIDALGHTLARPLTYIGEYAFAGAKNLEELTICSCTQDIEATSFIGCENLKKLNIESISFFSCPGFHIRDHGKYYFESNSKIKAYLPFEIITFTGDVVQIFPNALKNFTNVKTLNLPNNKPYNISQDAFIDCTLLEKVNIPNQVMSIFKSAFPSNTTLVFENGLVIKGLVELINNDKYIGKHKLYVSENGTYYIEQDDKITTITKKYMDEICTHSEKIHDKPVLFLDFLNDLIDNDLFIKPLLNGILISNLSLDNRKILFENLNKDDKFFLDILRYSNLLDDDDKNTVNLLQTSDFNQVIKYVNLLKKYNIQNKLLYNKFLMANYEINYFENLINFDLELLINTIHDSHLFDNDCHLTLVINNYEKVKQKAESYYLTYHILEKNTLEPFIKYVKKYNIKDKYLFNKPFIAIADDPLASNLFKIYDANTKRLLKSSMVTELNISSIQNLKDLLILMKITGALEDDPIIRQRASTFITEKIFDEKLPNGNNNNYRIVGDDIHRIFNFPYIRDEFDNEFADFFIENYQQLVTEEKQYAGFIQRVYLNFRQISKTSTSNKGSQRKLKVTMEKCKNFLSTIKFDGVTEETQKLALLIGAWYDNNTTWLNAQRVYYESLNAPRNIFVETTQNEDEIIVFDNDPKNDLREPLSPNFSYEWLPKQDYDNLVLGKYCNCCAHIDGAGQGIMRASMILDNCQNLVIRNEEGLIIAKATLYVNRQNGYAVFNNVEASLNYRSDEQKQKIYDAFLRGANAFVNTYNQNNPKMPISNITIGSKRNIILECLTDDKHPDVNVQPALEYGKYSLNNGGWNGDWAHGQRLVLKR